MCCGQKRQAQGSFGTSAIRIVPVRTTERRRRQPALAPFGLQRRRGVEHARQRRYLRNSPIRVRGAGSGRSYDFSPSRQTQLVDRRDLPGLLRTGLSGRPDAASYLVLRHF